MAANPSPLLYRQIIRVTFVFQNGKFFFADFSGSQEGGALSPEPDSYSSEVAGKLQLRPKHPANQLALSKEAAGGNPEPKGQALGVSLSQGQPLSQQTGYPP